MDEALHKIQAEITANASNFYIQAVGPMLRSYLLKNPKVAPQILVEGKTIGGSIEAMRKEAEKKKTGNCAVLTDQEGFEIVLKYYGIEAAGAQAVTAPPAGPDPGDDFTVDLDELLK